LCAFTTLLLFCKRSTHHLAGSEWTNKIMTRRLLASHLRNLLSPATTPSPKPFSFSTSQQNPLSQSRFLPWQFKPNRSLYFSTYKPSELPFSALSRYIVRMGRFLTTLRRRGGNRQRPVHKYWYLYLSFSCILGGDNSRSNTTPLKSPPHTLFLFPHANAKI
jgi:hypothetical protein